MKTKILKYVFVVAIAMVAGINVFNAQNSLQLSDVALANVEALADAEVGGVCETYCYQCDGWMCGRIYDGETTRCMNHRKIQ